MPKLDDERLRYPIEYIDMVGGKITELREVTNKPDLWQFKFLSSEGFFIDVLARKEFVGEIKEGAITEGEANGILKYDVPENNDLSQTRIFMSIEDWNNVKIE